MATNKSTRDTMVVVAILMAVMLTVTVNLLADKKFARIDLTAEGRYRLSEPFKNIIGRLEDTAKLTYYVSGQVPGWFETNKRDILDKLNEIKTASDGKIELEVVDPTENKELLQALEKEGFVHQVQELKKEEISVSRLLTGIKITYRDKPKQSIPAVGSAEDVEYVLGSKIVELTLKKKPVIAIQAPAAGPNPHMMQRNAAQTGYEWLQSGEWDDAKKFDVKSVELTEASPIPPEAQLLVLIRPTNFNDRQRYEVEKYLASGGKVLLIASPFKVSHEFSWKSAKTPTGLEDYLKEVGLSFGDDFIADNANLRMPKSINMFTNKVEYSRNPFFVRILAENIDQESVVTRLMPGLLMPSPAEIKISEDAVKKSDLKLHILAKTSKQSWTVPFSENINPDLLAKYDEAKQEYTGSKNVFVMLEGQFPFSYEGKPVPEWSKAAGPEGAPPEKKDDKKPAETATVTKKAGALVVCACPEAFHLMYLNDQQIGREMQGNASLIVNMSEIFSLGEDLIKIRSKKYESRTIDKLAGTANDTKRNAMKLGLIAGVPALVVFFALIRTMLRRAAQTRYERNFAQTSGPSSFSP